MPEREQPNQGKRSRPRADTIEESLLKNASWMPVPYEIADATAMKALATGTANSIQQMRALTWIQRSACALPDWAYRPGANDRDTNIALGRQFVGHQIQHLITAPTAQMQRNEVRADPHDPTTS
jgi:hypothetical protein